MTTVSAPVDATAPQHLDRAGIAARIPHAGSMCLLDRLLGWDDGSIRCTSDSHRDPAHPLRDPAHGRLDSVCAIEIASQAMALHGALGAAARRGDGAAAAVPGYLASARQVRLHVPRLDDVAGPLQVHCERLAGADAGPGAGSALYRFAVRDVQGRCLVEGRAAVVLDATLKLPTE